MVEAESTLGGDAPPSAPAAPVADWSDVRGFQVVAQSGAEPAAAPADPEAHARELAKELEVRAARFAQSIDESIVLASDGVIRWLGDPVARLIGGDDILKPRTVLLADEALASEGRQSAEARLALWITAHIRKVLGALEALAEPGVIGEPAREVASRIVQALGVLERDRVRVQVKNLDQGARAALRKLGVRFGAFYIYVPALLKPGARTLCSQLWSLRRGTEPGAERLLAFAAAGRTSFPAEAPLGPETYRVAGFRLCGDRVVRVDIVERLTDLIRAAIPDHMRPGGRSAPEAAGFVISPQMTSLTGCAGESFASILRSLGFESHRVQKADYEAALRKPPAPVEAPSAAAAGHDAGEAAPVESPALELAGVVEMESDAEPTATAPVEDFVEAKPERDLADEEPVETASVAEAAEVVDVPTLAIAPEAVEPTQREAEPAESLPLEIAAQAAEVAETPPQPGAPEAAAALPAAEDESIEVWRPAPRRRPPPPRRPGAAAGESEGEAASRPSRPAYGPRRRHGRDRDATVHPAPSADAQTDGAQGSEAPALAASGAANGEGRREGAAAHRHGGQRRFAFKGSGSEEGRGKDDVRPAREPFNPPPKKEPRAQPVDMDSPFAKLLALKPLLERRDKRT